MTDEEQVARFEAWADRVDPADLVSIDVGCLRRLRALVARGAPEEEVGAAARECRDAGHGWGATALCLGMTGREAADRYG